MKFGVGMYSAQRPEGSSRSFADLYADMIRQARLAEEVGLDSFWIAEHHFAEDGYVPAVLPVCGAVLASTHRLVAGTAVAIASFYNPIRLAEDAIALDLLSGGRFVLGLSLCYRDEEFVGLGVDRAADEATLEATARALRDAFSGRPVRGSVITPLPSTPGGPPLMMAADGERGAERAARLADMLMVDPTEPWPVAEEAVGRFDAARGDSRGEIVLFVYGGLSTAGRERAWNEVADGFRYMRHNYDRWMGRPETQVLPPEHYRLLLGTPQDVAEQAREYANRFGDRVHLVLRCNYPGMAPDAVRRQLELWGEAAKSARI